MVKVLEELHGTQQWKEALVKNGWTDAFVTGAQFEQFLKDQDNRVVVDADRAGAGMTATTKPQENAAVRHVDKAQYLVVRRAGRGRRIPDLRRRSPCEAGFAKVDPVGPRMLPDGHRHRLLVLAVVLAIAIPRGSVEADAGEDIDPDVPRRLAHRGPAGRRCSSR